MKSTIDQLIINSPYEKPEKYWSYDRGERLFDLKDGRRPAGYVVASEKSKAFDDPGIFVEIPLVNAVRLHVRRSKIQAGLYNAVDQIILSLRPRGRTLPGIKQNVRFWTNGFRPSTAMADSGDGNGLFPIIRKTWKK